MTITMRAHLIQDYIYHSLKNLKGDQDLMFQQTKLSKRKSWLFLSVFVASFFIIMIFLTSKIFLWDDSKILSTPIGTEQRLSSQEVVLVRWEYDPNKELMEVEIGSKNLAKMIVYELEFTSKEKTNPDVSLPTEVVSQFENTTIIQIENVTKDFQAVALTMKEKPIEGGDEKEEDALFEHAVWTVYADYREITINEKLMKKGDYEYVLDHIEREIAQQKMELKNIEESIKLKGNEMEQYERDIKELEASKQYQTEQETKLTEIDIRQKLYLIENTEKVKVDLEIAFEEANEKLQKLNEKLHDHKQKNKNYR